MKILKNKNLTQKIIIAIVIMISFNFIAPTYSRADFGGVLLGPVIDLVAGIGDAVMALLQYFMDGGENIELSSKGFLVKSTEFNPSEYGMEPGTGIITKEIDAEELDHGWFGWGTYSIPIIKYSAEKIFSNQVPGLDANFINPTFEGDEKSIADNLQETISSWYNALRNLVVVLLLSVLLYVGIRMMLTSISSDKAKYKQMLMDWLIALCLLFFLHYIMSFTMTFVEMITEGLANSTDINVQLSDGVPTFKTNLTGYCRMLVQYADFGERMVYLIFYIALVVYTFMFTWKYMKRAITMAFLTLMAPLVTLTYPIDKIGDGKAQAFNMWLKEYIYNALLQPFHLIIYTIFLGGSMNIAVENPLYAILFLAFITPAEKILRKFFKFEQATTADSSFAGGFGGAAAFNMVKGLVNKGSKSLSSSKGGNGGSGGNNIKMQKPIEDTNSPQGYSAFAIPSAHNQELSQSQSELTQPQTAGQQMLDTDNGGTNYNTPDGFEESLRAAGYEEDQINNIVRAQYGQQEVDTNQEQIRQQEPVEQPKEKEDGRIIRGVKAMGAAGTATLKYTGGKLKDRFTTKEGLKGIGRAAVKTVSAGVGATIGIGMGIAGDNLEDVLTYGTAGTTLGATALNNMVLGAGSKVANSGVVKAASQAYREQYHGGVNAAAIARQTKQLKQAGEIRDYIGNNITHEDGTRLSKKELDSYEDRAIDHYNSGVTDMSAIKKTLKLEDSIKGELEGNNDLTAEDKTLMAKEQAQTISKIADKVDDKKLMTDQKYADGLKANFTRGLEKANPNMSSSDLNKQSEKMMKLLRKYKKID